MRECDVPRCAKDRAVAVNQVRLCVDHYRRLLDELSKQDVELRRYGGNPLELVRESPTGRPPREF